MNKATVLFIAPHADDEMLAAAGCLMNLRQLGADIVPVLIVADDRDRVEQFRKACKFYTDRGPSLILDGVAGGQSAWDGALDQVPQRHLVTQIDNLLHRYQPGIMFVPWASEHQDHAAINRACLAAVRPSALHIPHRIMLYGYPGYGMGANVFSDITEQMPRKCEMFDDIYAPMFEGNSEGPYTRLGMERVAAYHGLQCGSKFAEGFAHVRGRVGDE